MITQEEAETIARESRALRDGGGHGACTAPLPLCFSNRRRPLSVAELDEGELRQLVAVGMDGMGQAEVPEYWLDPELEGESYYDFLEVWDVIDAKGELAYRVWMYLVDNGTVLKGDGIVPVGGISQGGLDCEEDGLKEALLAAKEGARAEIQEHKASLRFMGS